MKFEIEVFFKILESALERISRFCWYFKREI